MLIDWFTVGAQIVNFLVLMALLKKFLYDRVIQAMEEREQNIADRLGEAERKREEAEEKRKKIAAEEKELERRRDQLLSEARKAARSKREELEQEARAEVDSLRERWTAALGREKEDFARNVQRTAVQQVLAVSGRVLKDMAGEDLQERLIDIFAERIREMDAEEKRDLARGLDAKETQALVLSGAAVSSAKRQKITRLLHEEIHPDLDVEYRTDEELLGGIELRIPGKKVAWNPRQYLAELEENVLQALEEAYQDKKPTPPGVEGEKAKEASG